MISKTEVEHIAKLAHLEIGEEGKDLFTRQLGDILEYIEKLKELDTEQVVPTAYTVPMKNVMREDRIEPSLPREQVVQNAPQQEDGQFRVPPIIGE